MKILALSDTHLGHPGWHGFGEAAWERAAKLAQEQPIDVLLFCGDLCDPGRMELDIGLTLMVKVQAKLRLWVAGNNDIEWVRRSGDGEEPINDYPHVLSSWAHPFGVTLLDKGPVLYRGVVFVGNFGGYDLSLWRPGKPSPNFPATAEAIRADAEECHRQAGMPAPLELFRMCQERLHRHLDEVAELRQPTVIATHTVPDPGMVLYGNSPAYDYQNAAMGWDDSQQPHPLLKHPGLVLQLCGHTHRSGVIERPGLPPLVNVSGQDQPLIFEV